MNIISVVNSANQTHAQTIKLTFTEDMFYDENNMHLGFGSSNSNYPIIAYAIWTRQTSVDNLLRIDSIDLPTSYQKLMIRKNGSTNTYLTGASRYSGHTSHVACQYSDYLYSDADPYITVTFRMPRQLSRSFSASFETYFWV